MCWNSHNCKWLFFCSCFCFRYNQAAEGRAWAQIVLNLQRSYLTHVPQESVLLPSFTRGRPPYFFKPLTTTIHWMNFIQDWVLQHTCLNSKKITKIPIFGGIIILLFSEILKLPHDLETLSAVLCVCCACLHLNRHHNKTLVTSPCYALLHCSFSAIHISICVFTSRHALVFVFVLLPVFCICTLQSFTLRLSVLTQSSVPQLMAADSFPHSLLFSLTPPHFSSLLFPSLPLFPLSPLTHTLLLSPSSFTKPGARTPHNPPPGPRSTAPGNMSQLLTLAPVHIPRPSSPPAVVSETKNWILLVRFVPVCLFTFRLANVMTWACHLEILTSWYLDPCRQNMEMISLAGIRPFQHTSQSAGCFFLLSCYLAGWWIYLLFHIFICINVCLY